ncbi:MAG: glycerophosphodiester phosphodiesterase [Chlorobiales bacterium]|nr:glycerophosphodiester phosphodiesterase [Chlorobiales bacterium]
MKFDLEGHRGARGLLPENTIPAFLKALELGVTTLELDLAVSKDKKLVVSHEPWFSSEICSVPNGQPICKEDEMYHLIYEMTYEEIARYDCGKRGHPRFPTQQPLAVSKPLFRDMVLAVEARRQELNLPPVDFNIETKSTPEGDNRLHPEPKEFVELIHDEIQELGILERTILQSFDVRTLQEMRKLDPSVRISLLVENDLCFEENLAQLGFIPQIYSPDYQLVDETLIAEAHKRDIKVIPWTVNEPEEMRRLTAIGVNGLITDYPDRGKFLLQGK